MPREHLDKEGVRGDGPDQGKGEGDGCRKPQGLLVHADV